MIKLIDMKEMVIFALLILIAMGLSGWPAGNKLTTLFLPQPTNVIITLTPGGPTLTPTPTPIS